MNQELEFSHNWNKKLDCDYFTTLRLSNRFQVGEWVAVYEKKRFRGPHLILEKRGMKISQLNPWICGLDTGYTVPETVEILKRMYPGQIEESTEIFLYLLRKQTKAELKELTSQAKAQQASFEL